MRAEEGLSTAHFVLSAQRKVGGRDTKQSVRSKVSDVRSRTRWHCRAFRAADGPLTSPLPGSSRGRGGSRHSALKDAAATSAQWARRMPDRAKEQVLRVVRDSTLGEPLGRLLSGHREYVGSGQHAAADRPVATLDFLDDDPRDRAHRLAFDRHHRVGDPFHDLLLLDGREHAVDELDVDEWHCRILFTMKETSIGQQRCTMRALYRRDTAGRFRGKGGFVSFVARLLQGCRPWTTPGSASSS